jgi:hypothetical protein
MIGMFLWSDGHKCINKIIKVKNLNLSPFLFIFINSTSFWKYLFPNNQMVNTRSGAGQDIPFVIRTHIVSQLNQVPSTTTRISNGSHDAAVLYGTDAVNSEPHRHYPESTGTAELAATPRTSTTSTTSEQA